MKSKDKNNGRNYSYKILKDGQNIDRYQTRSKRRFLNRTRTINWQLDGLKVYLRVNYGKHLSNRGKMESFWNDGVYDNPEDFYLAFEAFTEE